MVSPIVKRKAEQLPGHDSKKPKGGSITAFFGTPKPKPAIKSTSTHQPSIFDKEKWIASLTPEQKELLQLEIDTLDESWLAHLKDEVTSTEFLNLKRFLKKEKDSNVKVFPPEEDIYSWYNGTTSGAGAGANQNAGPDTHPCTMSKWSSLARIRTTITTKPMDYVSPFVPLCEPRHRWSTSTRVSKSTILTSSHHPIMEGYSYLGLSAAS